MRCFAVLLILTAAGCYSAGARYSELDNQKSISADLGTNFYVSLPASIGGRVVYSPLVLNLMKESVDSGQRRILQFNAAALGETEIKVGSEYSLRVRVTSASDRPGMHIHQH